MIPLRDTIPSRTTPVVTNLLITLNVTVFVVQLLHGARTEEFLLAWAFIPSRLFAPDASLGFSPALAVTTLFTSMFLHGGLMHLLGNMLYLWIFGDNVEDELGHLRYLVAYLVSGASAALLQGGLHPRSEVPMVGASGAIAGVLGAYFVFFPRARVVTLVPLFFLFPLVEIPAPVYLLFWFLMQFWMGGQSLFQAHGDAGGGVAWWAHVGGFVAGLLLVPVLRPRRRPPPRVRLVRLS